jgi:hypothetical protein
MGLTVCMQHQTWGLVIVCNSTHGVCCFSNMPLATVHLIYWSVLGVLLAIVVSFFTPVIYAFKSCSFIRNYTKYIMKWSRRTPMKLNLAGSRIMHRIITI